MKNQTTRLAIRMALREVKDEGTSARSNGTVWMASAGEEQGCRPRFPGPRAFGPPDRLVSLV